MGQKRKTTVELPAEQMAELAAAKARTGIGIGRIVAIAVDRLLRDQALFFGLLHTEEQKSKQSGKDA